MDITNNLVRSDWVTKVYSAVRVEGRRALALILDGFLLSLLVLWLSSLLGVEQVTSDTLPTPGMTGVFSFNSSRNLEWYWLVLVTISYFTAQEALFGVTLGKRVLGLRVVMKDGSRITWQAALIRNLLRPIDAFPYIYLVGAIAMFNSPLRQRIGDRVAYTLVVPVEAVAAQVSLSLTQKCTRMGVFTLGVALLFVATLVMSYFVQPTRIIEGLHNTRQGPFANAGNVPAYGVRELSRSGDTTTYEVTYHQEQPARNCTFEQQLVWHNFSGWQPSGGGGGVCTP